MGSVSISDNNRTGKASAMATPWGLVWLPSALFLPLSKGSSIAWIGGTLVVISATLVVVGGRTLVEVVALAVVAAGAACAGKI